MLRLCVCDLETSRIGAPMCVYIYIYIYIYDISRLRVKPRNKADKCLFVYSLSQFDDDDNNGD